MVSKEDERLKVLRAASLDTRAIRAGQVRSAEAEHAEALYLTSSYVFDDAAAAAARFAGDEPGNVYSRYTNPTVRTFEQRLAMLEGADAAVATSSGMAAILSLCMSLLSPGQELVCSRGVFGSTTMLLNKYIARFGVGVKFVSPIDLNMWRAACGPKTRMLFVETPSNPLSEIADLAALAQIARDNNALLVVDNCFCTPALQQPLKFGAQIVMHSATKYIDGQGRCLGGAVCGSEEEMAEVLGFLRSAGPTMSPFNAWVFLKGLETLRLRMESHSRNAMRLAQWLEGRAEVLAVNYAGLPSHPQHELAKTQQRNFGGVVSFRVKGGRQGAWSLIDATRMLSITANLGDAKTTIIHPATTTHGRLTDDERAEQGITDDLVRIAVGLEDIEDIIADVERGLGALA